MKKVFSLLLSVAMLLSIVSAVDFSASASVQTGNFGECCEYTYSFDDSTGVLRIGEIGEMGCLHFVATRPWDSYNTSVKTIIVENGTQALDAGIFYNCPNLTSVSIPNTVNLFCYEVMTKGVFYGSDNVKEVHYASTKAQWDTLNIPEWTLNNAILYCTDGQYHFKHSFTSTMVMPTCTEQGYIHYKCYCGYEYNDSFTQPTGHNFANNVEYCNNGCGTRNPNYIPPQTTQPVTQPPQTTQPVNQSTQTTQPASDSQNQDTVTTQLGSIDLYDTTMYYNGKVHYPDFDIYDTEYDDIDKNECEIKYSKIPKNVGNYTLTVTYNGKSISKNFKIIPKVSKSYTLCIGSSKKLNAKSSSKIKYKSSNSKIVKVDKKGNVKALKKGSATITVYSAGLKSKCNITVKNPSVKISNSIISISSHGSDYIDATTFPLNKKLTYKSANTSVAKVTDNGVVKAVKPGKTTVTAQFKYNGKIYKKSINVTVYKAPSKVEMAAKSCILIKNVVAKYPSTFQLYNIYYVGNTVYLWYSCDNAYGGTIDHFARITYQKKADPFEFSIKANGGYIIVDPVASRPSLWTGTVSISKVNDYITKNPIITYKRPIY